MDNDLKLYFCPLTCARVTMTALEQTGASYEVQAVDIMRGEQKSPDYLAVNPQGKVPALKIGESVLTENVAILLYLADRFPQAGLLPSPPALVDRAKIWSDLVYCSSTLHPLARQIRAPFHYSSKTPEDVLAKGTESIKPVLAMLENRFAAGSWWYGAHWSIIDVYISWVSLTVASTGFDMSSYPAVNEHNARVRLHPSFQRMLSREGAVMEAAGLQLPPGVIR